MSSDSGSNSDQILPDFACEMRGCVNDFIQACGECNKSICDKCSFNEKSSSSANIFKICSLCHANLIGTKKLKEASVITIDDFEDNLEVSNLNLSTSSSSSSSSSNMMTAGQLAVFKFFKKAPPPTNSARKRKAKVIIAIVFKFIFLKMKNIIHLAFVIELNNIISLSIDFFLFLGNRRA